MLHVNFLSVNELCGSDTFSGVVGASIVTALVKLITAKLRTRRDVETETDCGKTKKTAPEPRMTDAHTNLPRPKHREKQANALVCTMRWTTQ